VIAKLNKSGPRGSPCRTPVRDGTVPYKSEASLRSKQYTVESREYIISTNGVIGCKSGFLYNYARKLRREMVLKAFSKSRQNRL
jgi:hypothetical protein